MTKRDLFALHAMAVLHRERWAAAVNDTRSAKSRGDDPVGLHIALLARDCYDIAEAMLAESKRRGQPTDETVEVWIKGGVCDTNALGDVHVVVHEPSDT